MYTADFIWYMVKVYIVALTLPIFLSYIIRKVLKPILRQISDKIGLIGKGNIKRGQIVGETQEKVSNFDSKKLKSQGRLPQNNPFP